MGRMDGTLTGDMSFGARWKLAWRVLWDGAFAGRIAAAASASTARPAAREQAVAPVGVPAAAPAVAATPAVAAAVTPEREHASGSHLLAALQREGRLVDFLQQDVTAFSDEDVASAARVVHAGCRRVLHQGLELGPAVEACEGATLSVPAGFDACRIRLTGNVTGNPPFRGVVRHAGWVVRAVRFPEVAASMDPRILAAAEVELP